MNSVSVYKADDGTDMKRPWYARIDGKILCKSNGIINRFKTATTATAGANREIERLKVLAVTLASRMPESSDLASKPGAGHE